LMQCCNINVLSSFLLIFFDNTTHLWRGLVMKNKIAKGLIFMIPFIFGLWGRQAENLILMILALGGLFYVSASSLFANSDREAGYANVVLPLWIKIILFPTQSILYQDYYFSDICDGFNHCKCFI